MKQNPLVITLEGGLVTGVSSADMEMIGRPIVVIDYDTDGAEPTELEQICWRKSRCGSAGSANAYVRGDAVVRTCLTATTQRKLMKGYFDDNAKKQTENGLLRRRSTGDRKRDGGFALCGLSVDDCRAADC